MEIRSSYQQLLGELARAPSALPSGTETAVIYYLPAESDKGYEASSLVLNRSAVVADGLQVNATLVFVGHDLYIPQTLKTAQCRLIDLLRSLGFEWIEG